MPQLVMRGNRMLQQQQGSMHRTCDVQMKMYSSNIVRSPINGLGFMNTPNVHLTLALQPAAAADAVAGAVVIHSNSEPRGFQDMLQRRLVVQEAQACVTLRGVGF